VLGLSTLSTSFVDNLPGRLCTGSMDNGTCHLGRVMGLTGCAGEEYPAAGDRSQPSDRTEGRTEGRTMLVRDCGKSGDCGDCLYHRGQVERFGCPASLWYCSGGCDHESAASVIAADPWMADDAPMDPTDDAPVPERYKIAAGWYVVRIRHAVSLALSEAMGPAEVDCDRIATLLTDALDHARDLWAMLE
jgi:hypothetical protein